jgi:glycosyltransferase involved in cell wall biosynthesis
MYAICAIDLDTILACLLISKLKSVKRVYDAHEYFTELKEVISRPFIHRMWKAIEQFSVPQFKFGYTVSPGITNQFKQQYKRHYITIRNLPVDTPLRRTRAIEKFLFFGGMVNEARGFEVLIPAMKKIPYPLIIAGDGNFMETLKSLIQKHDVADKVILKGIVSPETLRDLAEQATLGIGLAEQEGLNQFLALPNKFFDYMHAGLPQISMNFPEYARLNEQYDIAVLIDRLNENEVAWQINAIMQDDALLEKLRRNCLKAKKELNWQEEEKKLLAYYWAICHSS